MNSMKGFLLAGLLIWSLLISHASANLDPNVAKEYREAGADLIKYAPEMQSWSSLEKAKYAFEAYCNWLDANNKPVNSDLTGRAKNMGADWTCADHSLKLQEFFVGAGIKEKNMFVKAMSDDISKGVNINHGSLAIIYEGQVYFFDPWQLAVQNEKDGSTAYSGAQGSKWNGMTAREWEKEMKKQGYKRFSLFDGGLEEESLHKLLMDTNLMGAISWGIQRPFFISESGTIGEVYSFSISPKMKGIPKDAKLDWSYGDSGADTGKRLDEVVTHKYDSAGTYTVSVTASWPGEWSAKTTTEIKIEDKRSSAGSLGKIMSTKGAFVSRGNIKGGTDHLGFANCLCKCACSQDGWACGSGVACVYDANPKGECLCAGYGEGHTTVPSSGECYENCAREYKITGMQSNKTPLAPVNPSGDNPIMPGDLIQTTGETVIILKDGSKLLVKAGSILNFASTQSGKTEVNLILGSFRTEHATGSSASAGGPDVKIADKTVKPKGTEFVCQWDGASGKVSVVDGSVIIADETSEKTLEAGKQMDLPQETVTDYNLSADDGGLVAGIPLRDLILDEGEPEPFGEYDPSFAGGKIPDDWLWQDPVSDAELDSAPSGGLKVTVPDGNEFWGYPGVTAGQRSDAPRLLHKVTGDFDLQGRVYLDTEATDLATVEFLYFSPGSYIGLKSGLMKQDLLGEHYNLPGGGWLRSGGLNKLPVLERPPTVTYTGYSAELKSSPDAPDQPVFLKFTRRGNVLKTYHSLDGEKWILSSREEVNVSQTLWVGWVFKRFAYDGLTDKTAIVTLDDVRLKTAEPGTMPIPEWDEILQAGSAEIDGKTVRLHLDGSGKGTTGVQKTAGLVGDFSATVSFQAENSAPESGESRLLALVASNSNGQNRTYIGWLHDPNHPSQFYVTNFFSSGHGSGSAHDYTGDWSGKLRIVRQDNNISTYFWKDGEWKVLGDFGTGFHDPVYIGMEVTNEQEASANASMTAEFTVDEIIGNAASEIKTTAEGETETNLPAAMTDD